MPKKATTQRKAKKVGDLPVGADKARKVKGGINYMPVSAQKVTTPVSTKGIAWGGPTRGA